MSSRFVCHSIAFPVVLFVMMSSCVHQQAGWEGSVADENGVTLICNPSTPRSLGPLVMLREQFALQESDRSLLGRGLSRFRDFAVDSSGNLFLLTQHAEKDFVFKFDGRGRFQKSFIRRGQGPGELQVAHRIRINARDELTLRDPTREVLLVYNTDGSFLEEVSLPPGVRHIDRLPGDRYLISRSLSRPGAAGTRSLSILLCDGSLNEIKELCRYDLADKDYHDGRIEGRIDAFYWTVDGDRIFVGTDMQGYEILVFDLAGTLLRRIRKDYLPVPYPDPYKRSFREAWKKFPQVGIRFPQHLPPFHSHFTDEEGRLFVQTFEPGPEPGSWMHDIFDAEGILIGRQDLQIAWRGGSLGLYAHALVRAGRLYCLQAREGGYHALVVYLMVT